MKQRNNFRGEIIDALVPYFRKDKRYYLLACDMGFGLSDRLRKEFPCRVINCGIMEQGTVGIAAGMSMSGLIPIVYSIVNFLVFRALEQIRNDVVLQGLNVKFISTGCEDYFKALGASHCCAKDDIALMRLIRMKVYDPYLGAKESIGRTAKIAEKVIRHLPAGRQEGDFLGNKPFGDMVRRWIKDPAAGYIRV